MRRLLPFAALLVGACAARPADIETPPVTVAPAPIPRTGILGATQSELVARFGAPSFRVSEGPGLKLQWQGANCVLDAYLYPSTNAGTTAVTHVDARRPGSGESVSNEACIAALSAR